MSRPNVSSAQIFSVIEELIRSGNSPTVAKVRTALGDRGNANTILSGIHAWFDARGPYLLAALDNPDAVANINLKSAMKDATKNSLEAIAKINDEYEKKLAEISKQLDSRQQALDQREQAMLDAGHAKDQHIADLQGQLTEAKDEASRYKSQSDLERIMVADLEAQVTRLMHQNNQDALKHELQHTHNSEQIQSLQDALNKAQIDNQKLHEQVVSLEQQTAIAQSNLVLSTHTVTTLENTAREAYQTHKAEIDYLREQLASSQSMFETISTHHKLTQTSMQELATTLRNDLKTSAKQTQDAIQTIAKKTKDHLDNLTTTAASTTKQLNEIERKVSHLKPTSSKSKPDKQTPSDQ